MLPDTPSIKRKLLSRLLLSGWSMTAVTLGLSGMIGGWALGYDPAVNFFLGGAGFLIGAGIVASKYLLSSDAMIRDIQDELRNEILAAEEAKLDALDKRLIQDNDRETNEALATLRSLAKRLDAMVSAEQTDARDARLPPDVWSVLTQLIDSAIASLSKSADLHEAMQQALTDEARDRLATRRTLVLTEVQASIQHVAHTLDEVQTISLRQDAPEQRLSKLRQELDQSLAVAKRVEQRMQDMEHHLGQSDEVPTTGI